MNPSLYVVIADASFAAINAVDGPGGTGLIQGVVHRGGFASYITGNLTPPGGTVYVCRQNADGSFLVSQSKQPTYAADHTFAGWAIPA